MFSLRGFMPPLCGRVFPRLTRWFHKGLSVPQNQCLWRKGPVHAQSTYPIRLCVIKRIWSLAACPFYSLTFTYTSLYICPQFSLPSLWLVRWSDCFLLPHPQWYLAILICMYMPLLCGRRATEIDQQRSCMFYYMSVGGRKPDAMGTYTHTHTLMDVHN